MADAGSDEDDGSAEAMEPFILPPLGAKGR
jgi:hypothetical protein